jgi:nuclear cap-binding protein subunit 1
MSALLQSFVAVLDEFGVSHRRAKNAALCAAEGIMRAGPSLLASPASTSPEEMLSSIQTYTDSVVSAKGLVQPLVRLHDVDSVPEGVDEVLDSALAALRILVASDFAETSSVFPDLYSTLPPVRFQPFELPSILVPPEAADYELDTDTTGDGTNDTENSSGMAAAGSGSSTGTVKKEDWPEYMPRLFPDDVTPNPSSPAGYAVRSALIATIDIFEVNRKECARLLLEYPKWAPEGTFRPRPGLPGQPSAAPGANADGKDEEGNPKPAPIPVPGKDWQLESTLIETILGMAFLLPEPFAGHKTLYYSTLITELAKLSPTTVGPAVGKSIRRLYSLLGDEGLDPEIGRRFAEWFAVHMSNFGFGWVWKEWIPDLELPGLHPKRVFIRRAVELEVRLAYYDRITKTLPEVYCDPALAAIPAQAPGPSFEYEDLCKFLDLAQSNWLLVILLTPFTHSSCVL